MSSHTTTVPIILLSLLSIQRSTALSHDEAVRRVTAKGISIWSSGRCSNRYNADCTSLEGIRDNSVNMIITLKEASGCPITITGATEDAHGSKGAGKTHWNGYKFDISLNDCITRYIKRFRFIGTRGGDKAAMWQSGAGNIYALEDNHWDIVYV